MDRGSSAWIVLSTVTIGWVAIGSLPAQPLTEGYTAYPFVDQYDSRSATGSGLNAETRAGNAPYPTPDARRREPGAIQVPRGGQATWGEAVRENPQSHGAQAVPYSRQAQGWMGPQGYTPGPQLGMGPREGLNGIWRGSGGDLLAVYERTFLWSDLHTKHLAGTLVLTGNRLLAYVAGSEIVMTFEFQQYGDEFRVRDESGQVTVYRRLY